MIRLRENSTPRHLPTGFRAANEPARAWSGRSDVRPAARLVGVHESGKKILAGARDCGPAHRRSSGYRRAVLDRCPLYLHSVLNSTVRVGASIWLAAKKAAWVRHSATPPGGFDSWASPFTIGSELSCILFRCAPRGSEPASQFPHD